MRPWVLRALIMTLLYGVGQMVFVLLSSRYVSLSLLWTVLLLGLLLLVGLVWAGAEVIADRIPPEWTWVKASIAAGPGAGLLTWILLALFVDATGVEDLGAAIVGRASFTILLILLSTALGARFGWLSLRRSDDPRADEDPAADVDLPADDAPQPPTTVSGRAAAPPVLPASTTEKVASRRTGRDRPVPASSRSSSASPARARREAGTERDGVRVPFGTGPFAERPSASPVVAVLPPVTPLPEGVAGRPAEAPPAPAEEPTPRRRVRKRFGLNAPEE